jgi:hypothetical protein
LWRRDDPVFFVSCEEARASRYFRRQHSGNALVIRTEDLYLMAASKYTPEACKTIIDAIKLGETYKGAAMAAGISERTFYEWREPHPRFSQAIIKATSDMRRANIAYIADKAPKHWQAAAWLLERRFPDEFGRRSVEVSGPGGGPIATTEIQRAGEFARELRANPEAFKEYEALLSRYSDGENKSGGIRDDNDASPKRTAARRP